MAQSRSLCKILLLQESLLLLCMIQARMLRESLHMNHLQKDRQVNVDNASGVNVPSPNFGTSSSFSPISLLTYPLHNQQCSRPPPITHYDFSFFLLSNLLPFYQWQLLLQLFVSSFALLFSLFSSSFCFS